MKLEKKKKKQKTECFDVLGYLLEFIIKKNLAILIFVFFEIWRLSGFFPHEKSFVEVEIVVFRSKFCRKFAS